MENERETFYKTLDKNDAGIDVKTSKKFTIGGGSYGIASLVELEAKQHRFQFVIKKYSNPGDAEDALKNYLTAKAAGLKVFRTFRISEDRQKVIVTTGHTKNWVCIGSNNTGVGGSLGSLALPKLNSIKDFDKFLKDYFEQAKIATKKNIRILGDSPFFLVERGSTDNVRMDFVLGDLDNVLANHPTFLERNVEFLMHTLIFFAKENIKDPEIYLIQIRKAASDTLDLST